MNNAIVTVVHPQSLRWFPEFITGLREQTETNFHCIVVLDSVDLTDELETLLRQSLQSYEVLHSQRGPLLNRFVGLKASEVFGAERVACIDSDDIPGPTWVEVMMNTLDDCELAFCDLIPVDQDSAILGSAHFQHRYNNNTGIEVEVLNRGNLAGFGNTAFRTSLLPTNRASQPIFEHLIGHSFAAYSVIPLSSTTRRPIFTTVNTEKIGRATRMS